MRWQSGWHYSGPAEPTAVLVNNLGSSNETAAVADHLRASACMDLTSSGGSFLELRPRGSSKAAALSFVTTRLGLSRKKVLAIGDNDNDAEMLNWAGIGVAVAAASRGAVASADYVCHYGVARGVVEILRLIRSARRYYRGGLEAD